MKRLLVGYPYLVIFFADAKIRSCLQGLSSFSMG